MKVFNPVCNPVCYTPGSLTSELYEKGQYTEEVVSRKKPTSCTDSYIDVDEFFRVNRNII